MYIILHKIKGGYFTQLSLLAIKVVWVWHDENYTDMTKEQISNLSSGAVYAS